MTEDMIMKELHKFREEWAEQFNYDIQAMVADLRRSQRESGREVVTLPPKLVAPVTETGSHAKVETLSATNSAS